MLHHLIQHVQMDTMEPDVPFSRPWEAVRETIQEINLELREELQTEDLNLRVIWVMVTLKFVGMNEIA